MGTSQRIRRRPGYEHGRFITHLVHDLAPTLRGFSGILLENVEDPRCFREVIANIEAYAVARLCDDIPFRAAVRQVLAAVEKLPTWGASSDDDRRAKATEKFIWAEDRCRRYNKKLRFYRQHPGRIRRGIRSVLLRSVDIAHAILGDCDVNWGDCGFGPGVTFATGRSFHQKLGDQTCTSGAWGLAREALREWPQWLAHLRKGSKLSLVMGDRIQFVPKNAGTFRTIGIQSSLQVFVQKPFEALATRRLAAWGVDLSDQSRNRDLLGRWDEIATIDQTSASDCGALELYRWYLPPDWFAGVFAASSRFYTFKVEDEESDTIWHPYAKLSAMGNCTTFPLETLVFFAVARAATEYAGGDLSLVRAYGDDVIVPQNAALLTLEVLSWLGFMPNRDKTFVTGPFRETCGKDTLWGVDIRPVYVRKEPSNDTDLYGLHNRLLCNRMGVRFVRTLSYLQSLVERPFYGPPFMAASMGSLCLLSSGEVLSTWYSGKSTLVDGFFWSNTPYMEPVIVTRSAHAERWWRLEFQGKRAKRVSSGCEATDYLAFLAGRREGLDATRMVTCVRHAPLVGAWPVADLPYGVVDAEPRPASTRIKRWVAGEVIGA
nr:MAG: putative RNA polymerase [Eriocheir sinensis solspivirus 1]